ncbi:hypothetical protein C8R43DRAFT_1038754 [Mycena crocata]|nr:hypothetical protein C8R43DRAFT_1038754 [Mycena crocata]
MLQIRHTAAVLADAEAGDPQACLEYSLRLQFGIECTGSRSLVRHHLIKVVLNEHADDAMKSIAHSLLIDWYWKAFGSAPLPARYLHAAAHIADESVPLASGVASPVVLYWAHYGLERYTEKSPELRVQYAHVWRANKKRGMEVAKAENEAKVKRMKQPNRYVCANFDCPVSTDTGDMLRQCSGKCDHDKKPSYCSKDCQRADWKNHKPFCKAGALCSVIEKPEVKAKGKGNSGGAFEIPIQNPDGTTTLVFSSAMTPQMLKEMKAVVEAEPSRLSGPTFGGEIVKFDLGEDSDSDAEVD